MLTKLRFFRQHAAEELARRREGISPGQRATELGVEPGSLKRMDGGTLNVVFSGHTADGVMRACKTHLTGEGRLLLRREARFLDALYPGRVSPRLVCTPERDWLVMNSLEFPPPGERSAMSPDGFQPVIASAGMSEPGQEVEGTISDVLIAAREALDFLLSEAEITRSLASDLSATLDLLADEIPRLPPRFCHGDLGPRNVMRDRDGLILLDWEDAFHGVAGYDWICWLSFFENRPLVQAGRLRNSGLPPGVSVAILSAILLVKAELSVRSGSVRTNTLSNAERLSEALSANS